jgi:hypothetical protein
MDRGSLAHSLGGAPLPPRYAAELLVLLARAIQAAHDHGVLHRDVKPANVLLCSPEPGTLEDDLLPVVRLLGVPKLTDFGIAKRIGEDNRITRVGEVVGTPSYMAPEQAEGNAREATRAVDIYSLGAVLYECLTGRPPYQADTVLHTLDLVRQGEPVPPDRVVPGLPAELVTICLKAMAREPGSRYPSASALAEDLERFLSDQPVQAQREPFYERAVRWAWRRPTITALSIGLVSVSLALLFVLMLLWKSPAEVDDPDAVKVEYFGSVVRRWGLPEGVHPLAEEQVKRREVSFRFTFKGKLPQRVEAVDRLGRPTTAHSFVAYLERGDSDRPWRRECRWDYESDDNGHATRETARDRTGQKVWSFRYDTETTGHYTDKRGFPRPRAGSGAAYVSFVFDDKGLVTELRYLAANTKPRPDRNGIFGQRHKHDERGFVTLITFLGHNEDQVMHPDGYAAESRKYDERGNRIETGYLRFGGGRTLGPSGVARKVMKYDDDGNRTEVQAFGLDDRPIRRREGYATERRSYDGEGRLMRLEYFDIKGKPARDYLGVARVDYAYSDGGKRREESFFDEKGKPARHRMLACTRLTRVSDDEGHEAEVTAHGLDLKARRDLRQALPAPQVRRKYDRNGNPLEEMYFTENGKPTRSWFGAHRVVTRYERGHRVEMHFEDEKGKPVVPVSKSGLEVLNGTGPARVRWTWDDHGNNTEVSAFGLDGKLIDSWDLPVLAVTGIREPETPLSAGVARVRCRYDERGNRVELSHLNAKGEVMPPVRGRMGVMRGRLALEYDEHGNITDAALYGPDEKLAGGLGPTRVQVKYDEDGRPLEYALFGPEGKFALAGVHCFRFSYDRQGNRTSETFWDGEGNAVPGPSGYARAEYGYNVSSGNLSRSEFFDKDDRKVATQVKVEARERPGGMGMIDAPPVELEPGDILLKYDGQEITSTLQLHDLKRQEKPDGEPKSAEVLRKGKTMTVMLPSGFPWGDPFGDFRRRNGRGPRGNPFWFLRALPAQGLTPPLTLGEVRLRTEVVP